MENKNTNTICKYADANSYVMTCEPVEQATEQLTPAAEAQDSQAAEPSQDSQNAPAANESQATVPAAPAMEPAEAVETVDTEDIEVPIVGDTTDSYVEPLGETESWYPEEASSHNVVNYPYGTTSQYTASLFRPEEGFTASDIALIVIIAASLLAVVCSIILLTSRAAVNRRAVRKDFIRQNPR